VNAEALVAVPTTAKELRNRVSEAFLLVKKHFPFPGYMDHGFDKYVAVASALLSNGCLPGSRVLSIGAGACDCEAILSKLGYRLTALDDLSDHWHMIGRNRERILAFAEQSGVQLMLQPFDTWDLRESSYDAALMLDVIEHLHESPRGLLNRMISSVRPRGLLVLETPNATSLAKRLWMLFGKSSQVRLDFLFWNIGEYRSHIREYTEPELRKVLEYENMDVVASRMLNLTLGSVEAKGTLARALIAVYDAVSFVYPRFRDTILVVGRRPGNWMPTADSIARFKESYQHIHKYNLDGESDEAIIGKLVASR